MSLIADVIQGLNSDEISYVVVGGVAVVLHGRNRLTMDLDIVISLDQANVRKTVDLLTRLGLKPRIPVNPLDFADAEIRRQWVQDRGMTVFSFVDPAEAAAGVDIFAAYPLDYAGLFARAVIANLGPTPVRVCSIEDLIAMKRVANRRHDLDDIQDLERILHARNKIP
ncbi:MAG: nucleotidyl transferase AbiEii/AbiGii toxin family protein [Tepidisphaeraceae bacterium]